MSNMEGLVGAMIKPAIKRFVTDNPTVLGTFKYEGENLRIELWSVPPRQPPNPLDTDKPFASVVLTPMQQYEICREFLKTAGVIKK
jgi:hypothetical protein